MIRALGRFQRVHDHPAITIQFLDLMDKVALSAFVDVYPESILTVAIFAVEEGIFVVSV